MALNTCKMWFNGIKIAFFPKKLQKIVQRLQSLRRLAAPPPDPVCDTFEIHKLSQHVSKVRYLRFSSISLIPLSLQNPVTCQQATISDLPPFDIFVPKNFLFGKILVTSLHVICNLGLPQSKILATSMNWRSPKKLFLKTFFLENTCGCILCPWPRAFLSLTSGGPVLGKGCP